MTSFGIAGTADENDELVVACMSIICTYEITYTAICKEIMNGNVHVASFSFLPCVYPNDLIISLC